MKPNMTGDRFGPRIAYQPQLIGAAFISLLSSSGLIVGAVNALGFAGVGALALGVGYAAAIGAGLLLQSLTKKTPAAATPSDVQSNIRQPISARRRLYGGALNGSVIPFGFRRGEKSYLLHYICEGPIEGYTSFRLDKKPVTLDVDGYVTNEQYQVGGRSRVRILTTLGTMSDEPFAELIAAFPELDHTDPGSAVYGKPFRHRGCAMVLQIVEQVPQENLQDVYPNNMPSLQVLVKGFADVEDPRDDSVGWTDNAGLCLLHEIKDVYGLTSADTAKINFASFADFADHSDESVALAAGGSEARYRAGGTIFANAENEARILALANVCNADVYLDSRGRIAVRQKLRSTPGIALRHSNGDHLTLQIEGGRGIQKKFNTVKALYVDPSLNYKENEVTWQHAGMLADDGKELTEPLNVALCPSPTQAQRLAKLFLYENNPDYIGQLASGVQALELIEDYAFTLDLTPEDDIERTAAAMGGIEFDANSMTVSAPFAVFGENATAWTPASDEQDQVIVPPVLPSDVDDVLLTVTPTVELLANSSPVLKFSWVAASGTLPDSYSQELQVSVAGGDEWEAANVNQTLNTAQYGPVADGGAYDWRIRNLAAGKTFDWQVSASPVSILVNAVAPVALSSFAVEGGLGHAAITITTANDLNLSKIELRRVPTGETYDEGDPDHTSIILAAAPGTTFGYVDGDSTRTNLAPNPGFDTDTIWVKGTGWTIGSGVAMKAAGTASSIYGAGATVAATYRTAYEISSYAAGQIYIRLLTGTNTAGTNKTGDGWKFEELTSTGAASNIGFTADSAFDGSIDGVVVYVKTAGCVAQGVWDYTAIPLNESSVPGPSSGPVTVIIY